MDKKNNKKKEGRILSAEKKVEKEFAKVEHEVADTIDKLSRVGLREYATYLSKPGRVFWINLLAGTARGLGFFFGAAIIVALSSFVLSILVDIPYIGEFFVNLNEFLKNSGNIYNNNGSF